MIIFMFTFRSRRFPSHFSSNLSDLSYNTKLRIYHFKENASTIMSTELQYAKENQSPLKNEPIVIINPIFHIYNVTDDDSEFSNSINSESTREKIIKSDSRLEDNTNNTSSIYRFTSKKDNRQLHEHLCIGRIISIK